MQAIIDLNGKQYQVEEGRYVTVDRLSLKENDELQLDNVLMIVDGEQSLVGAPYVDGAVVKARVLGHLRGPKVLVYKMRCKKGYRRKNGHRQDFTKLQIEVVDFPGKAERKPAEQPEAKPAKKAASKKAGQADEAQAETKKKTTKAAAKTAEKPKSESKPKAKDEAVLETQDTVAPTEVAELKAEAAQESTPVSEEASGHDE